MVIADAIAHAIDPTNLFSLHQQVVELEATMVEIQGCLADQADLVVQEKVHEALDEKGTSRSSKKVKNWRLWRAALISSFVLRCNKWELTSRIIFPECNHCPRTRVKCGGEKVELGYKTNPHANWS